eukprot:Em0012g221a
MQTFVRQEAVMWQKRGLLSIAESTSVLGSADNVSAISLPSSRALSLAGGEEEDNLTMHPPSCPPVVIENPQTPVVTGTGASIERHAVASGPPGHDVIYPMSVPLKNRVKCVSHDFYGTTSVLDSKVETVSHAMKIKSSWLNLLNLSCNTGYSSRHVISTVITLPTTTFQRKWKTNQGIFD